MHNIREDASFPLDGLHPGEQVLRYLVPSFVDVLLPFTRWFSALVLVFGVTVLATMVGGGLATLVHWALGIVVALVCLAVGTLAGLIVAYRTFPRATRWWVTTQRLVVQRGSQIDAYLLRDVTVLDANPRIHTLDLQISEDITPVTLGPLNALGELWGAVLFAKAWDAPNFDLKGTSDQDENVFRWANASGPDGRGRGLLVLRPHLVTWLPEQDYLSLGKAAATIAAFIVGVRVRRVVALPPLERFASLMRFATDRGVLDRECARVAQAVGSWSTPVSTMDWEIAANHALLVRHKGNTYTCPMDQTVAEHFIELFTSPPQPGAS